MQQCIKTLIGFAPRQLVGERKALTYLCSVLDAQGIPYTLEKFRTAIPVATHAELRCDGKRIDAEACCMVSGTIEGKDNVISAAMPSRYCSDAPNISFNPSCPVIAPGNHYFAPALAVTHAGLQKILRAKKVHGDRKSVV